MSTPCVDHTESLWISERGPYGKRLHTEHPPKVCQECEREFTKPKNTSRKDWARAKFCNRTCANRASSRRKSA